MNIVEAIATRNKCYQVASPLYPRGIMLHSIGCPQPSAAVLARNYNQYQPGGQSVCVHGFIQSDGTYYHTLPYNIRAWHCGGAANGTHIGIEMTEPSSIVYTGGANWRDLNPDATWEHVSKTYDAAVELFAQLCTQFGFDPLEDGVIIGHSEGAARGVASNHGDPVHIWRVFGLTMDGFRQDVYNAMHNVDNDEEEEDMVRYNSISEVPEWGRKDVEKLIDCGALKGDNDGNLGLSLDMLRGAIIGMRYADAQDPIYKTIDDIPSWARPRIKELIDKGILAGEGNGVLNLRYSTLRSIIICQNMISNK